MKNIIIALLFVFVGFNSFANKWANKEAKESAAGIETAMKGAKKAPWANDRRSSANINIKKDIAAAKAFGKEWHAVFSELFPKLWEAYGKKNKRDQEKSLNKYYSTGSPFQTFSFTAIPDYNSGESNSSASDGITDVFFPKTVSIVCDGKDLGPNQSHSCTTLFDTHKVFSDDYDWTLAHPTKLRNKHHMSRGRSSWNPSRGRYGSATGKYFRF